MEFLTLGPLKYLSQYNSLLFLTHPVYWPVSTFARRRDKVPRARTQALCVDTRPSRMPAALSTAIVDRPTGAYQSQETYVCLVLACSFDLPSGSVGPSRIATPLISLHATRPSTACSQTDRSPGYLLKVDMYNSSCHYRDSPDWLPLLLSISVLFLLFSFYTF